MRSRNIQGREGGSMRKLKVYLDTTIISYLFADDTPSQRDDTLLLWEHLKKGKCDIYLSVNTLGEILDCDEPKRSKMLAKLKEIEYTTIDNNDEIKALSNAYIKNDVLKQKSIVDSLHVACAVISNCDMLLSWNFRHLANPKTEDGVKYVNSMNNYIGIRIIPPSMLIHTL